MNTDLLPDDLRRAISDDFEPVKAGVAVMRECYGLGPDQFKWREPPYEYEHDKMPIDILAGSTQLRERSRPTTRVPTAGRSC